MDQLITIVFVLIVSAIATLIKKKAQAAEEARQSPTNRPGQPRPSVPAQPQRKPVSWEEELRRLLEGEQPTTPPPIRPPAPVIKSPPPRPTPPAPVNPPIRRLAPKPGVVPIPVPSVEITNERLAPMSQSRQAYERASQRDTAAPASINREPGELVQLTTVAGRSISIEVAQAVSLFKTARTARQAVLASVILGPPKALEESATLF